MSAFVENYFALSTKLLKKDLKKAIGMEPVEGKYLNFVHEGRASALDYSIEHLPDETSYLIVQVGEEPQRILLSQRELKFGPRYYLSCGCGNKTNSLFLKRGYFACRRCQNLHYRSTRINKTSDHGQLLFIENRRLRLIEEREKISRPIYQGRYTRRFLKWLGRCNKAGIFDEAVRAWKAMEAIKGYRTQKS